MQHSRRTLIAAAALAASPMHRLALGAEVMRYSLRDDVRMWAAEVSEARKIPFPWILETVDRARFEASSFRLMNRQKPSTPPKPKNWISYKEAFVSEERISRGRRFMKEHADILLKAQDTWHVPAAITAAVIGEESNFGKNMGRYSVLNVLVTLSFDYERRAGFYRSELSAYLLLCYAGGINPASVQGSFAGAVGLCQFMPSNILKLGVDMDGDGSVDLVHSAPDAIGSVANFLGRAGWDEKLPVVWECGASQEIARELDCGGTKTNTTLQNALDAGVEIFAPISAPPSTPVLLIDLPFVRTDGSIGTLWRLGTKNFSALLEYNRSYFYAEGVRELAARLEQQPVQAFPQALPES